MWLLLANAVFFAMAHGGLVPQEISAFGIRSSSINQDALLLLFRIMVGYLGIAFLLRSIADYQAWQLGGYAWLRERAMSATKIVLDDVRATVPTDIPRLAELLDDPHLNASFSRVARQIGDERWIVSSRYFRVRAMFEVAAPLLVTAVNFGLEWVRI
ncbi:MAG: hypothetical protein ACYC7A_17835 [Thermoanaerobaculia bacterium]